MPAFKKVYNESYRSGFYHPISILILALITLTVALAIFANSGFFANKNVPTPSQTPQPSPKPSPKTSPADETANWKTYNNKEGRYTLRYPIDLTVYEENGTTYFNNSKVSKKGAFLIWIRVALKPEEQTQLEFWTEYFKHDLHTGEPTNYSYSERLDMAKKFINDSEKVLVGEEKIEGIKYISPDVFPVTTVTWFIKDKTYYFQYALAEKSSGLSEEQKEKLANQILSTFRFLD